MSERESFDAEALEQKVDNLLELCLKLRKENRVLREDQARLHQAQHLLQGKKEAALNRVKGMISRMRSLEREL